MARHAARTDDNQAEVVKRLREFSRVTPTHQVGGGFPDLVVQFMGRTILMEVKMPGESLNKDQAKFFAEWNGGEIYIVRTPEEALKHLIGEQALA